MNAAQLPQATELPLGAPGWGDTWIELPRGGEARMLVSVLGGTGVQTRDVGGRCGVALSEVLVDFPVALLMTP